MATARIPTPPRPRPRYARLGAAVGSTGVTFVTALAVLGVLPTSPASPGFAAVSAPTAASGSVAEVRPGLQTTSGGSAAGPAGPALPGAAVERALRGESAPAPATAADRAAAVPLPSRSGTGERVVFSRPAQRVWLVADDGTVKRTYPVSGSVTDNLDADTYQVYSKSRHAIGIDDSGTMEYMVRFASGENAAIGFHSIPVKDGHLIQSKDELGTPRSHGCIRQAKGDARALWRFTDVGTTVVVL